MPNLADLTARKKIEHGKKFSATNLAKQFIPYYENGERITVRFGYGETKRGTIGITTGWQPVFLLMLTKRNTGSSHTLSKKDKIV